MEMGLGSVTGVSTWRRVKFLEVQVSSFVNHWMVVVTSNVLSSFNSLWGYPDSNTVHFHRVIFIYIKSYVIYLDQKLSEKKATSLGPLLVIGDFQSLGEFATTTQHGINKYGHRHEEAKTIYSGLGNSAISATETLLYI